MLPHSFCLYIFFLHYMVAKGYSTVYYEAGWVGDDF